MNRTYDIFRGAPEGGVLWLEAIIGIDAAIARVKQRALENPGSYFVHDPQTHSVVVSIDSGVGKNAKEPQINRIVRKGDPE